MNPKAFIAQAFQVFNVTTQSPALEFCMALTFFISRIPA